MARKFIVDGTEYPDPGADVSPEQFKQMMVGFLPELANADSFGNGIVRDTIGCEQNYLRPFVDLVSH